MSVLSVNYDLVSPGKDYSKLYDALKGYTHKHALDSLWYLDTSKTPSTVRDELKKHIDSNDKLIVFRLHQNWASSFSDSVASWLKSSNRSWD